LGEGAQDVRADRGDGFGFVADQRDGRAERFEAGFEECGDVKRHVALADRLAITDDKPALLHFRPVAADVAGVDGDVEIGEWLIRWGG